MNDVVIVGEPPCSCRNPEVTILRQNHILSPQTHLIILFIVSHPVMEQHRENILVIFNLSPCGEGFVTKISQAAGQKLIAPISSKITLFKSKIRGYLQLMGELLGPVVQHSHDVRVVVFAVVVERVEEEPHPDPHVRRPENIPIIGPLALCEPKCLQNRFSAGLGVMQHTYETVGPHAPSSRYTEGDVHLPPVEVYGGLRPDCALLASQTRRNSDIFRAGYGIYNSNVNQSEAYFFHSYFRPTPTRCVFWLDTCQKSVNFRRACVGRLSRFVRDGERRCGGSCP